jgi:hypothetical protein
VLFVCANAIPVEGSRTLSGDDSDGVLHGQGWCRLH